jgi:hypothetical protein
MMHVALQIPLWREKQIHLDRMVNRRRQLDRNPMQVQILQIRGINFSKVVSDSVGSLNKLSGVRDNKARLIS